MERCSFFLSLSLIHLEGARWITDENPYTYEEEKGLFLPSRGNLYVSEKGYPYLNAFANPLNYPKKRLSHTIHLPPNLLQERHKGEMVYKEENLGYLRIIKHF